MNLEEATGTSRWKTPWGSLISLALGAVQWFLFGYGVAEGYLKPGRILALTLVFATISTFVPAITLVAVWRKLRQYEIEQEIHQVFE